MTETQSKKKVLLPCTNRVHKARQTLLIKELHKRFDLDVVEFTPKSTDILGATLETAEHFKEVLNGHDLAVIRGDRFEVLPIAMMCAYRGIQIAHIEGGDLSGAIDNKVRYAITALADIHFSTNDESKERIENIAIADNVYNFGSLDVEYAKAVGAGERGEYAVMCYHPMPDEDPDVVRNILREEYNRDIIIIRSNADNGTPYGEEEYEPQQYIKLIGEAEILVGNSSSFLKEASVFGTPVVDIGERQNNRLKPENVISAPYDEEKIREAIREQIGKEYEPSDVYYQEDTAFEIANMLELFLQGFSVEGAVHRVVEEYGDALKKLSKE